jgi:hypothetical protein
MMKTIMNYLSNLREYREIKEMMKVKRSIILIGKITIFNEDNAP